MSIFGLFGSKKSKKDKLFKNITRNVDPETLWKIVGDLGEGSFGMVHKVGCVVLRFIKSLLAD
jgi:hypothetical protein